MPAGQWRVVGTCLEAQLLVSCCPLNGELVWALKAETSGLSMEPPPLPVPTGVFQKRAASASGGKGPAGPGAQGTAGPAHWTQFGVRGSELWPPLGTQFFKPCWAWKADPGQRGCRSAGGSFRSRPGTDRWTPEHLSGRWCRREPRDPASMGAALWCSVAVWDMASCGGKSHSPLQQVSVEHLLRASCCSRPLVEHVCL